MFSFSYNYNKLNVIATAKHVNVQKTRLTSIDCSSVNDTAASGSSHSGQFCLWYVLCPVILCQSTKY